MMENKGKDNDIKLGLRTMVRRLVFLVKKIGATLKGYR